MSQLGTSHPCCWCVTGLLCQVIGSTYIWTLDSPIVYVLIFFVALPSSSVIPLLRVYMWKAPIPSIIDTQADIKEGGSQNAK